MQAEPLKYSIFISYRRDDTYGEALALNRALQSGPHEPETFSSFMDISAIPGGAEWRTTIEQALESVDALVALIGRNWLTVTDQYGRRRIDDEEDLVRHEIYVALRREILVIPCLVDARMPPRQALPSDIAGLAERQAIKYVSAVPNPWESVAMRIRGQVILRGNELMRARWEARSKKRWKSW